MCGIAAILLGFLSFGCLHVHTPGFEPWQWLYTILGVFTLFTSVLFWFYFPDSPANAWFLTDEERVQAVIRIRDNQAGVENKTFKREQ
jgi:ACS family allantoate permease-like MFS transporter